MDSAEGPRCPASRPGCAAAEWQPRIGDRTTVRSAGRDGFVHPGPGMLIVTEFVTPLIAENGRPIYISAVRSFSLNFRIRPRSGNIIRDRPRDTPDHRIFHPRRRIVMDSAEYLRETCARAEQAVARAWGGAVRLVPGPALNERGNVYRFLVRA